MKKNFYVLLNDANEPVHLYKLTLEENFVITDILCEVNTDYELVPIENLEYTEIRGEKK